MIGFSIFLTLFIPSRCGRTARSGNAGNADIQANKINNITGTRTNQQLYIMRENTAAEISLRRCCCFCIKPAYSRTHRNRRQSMKSGAPSRILLTRTIWRTFPLRTSRSICTWENRIFHIPSKNHRISAKVEQESGRLWHVREITKRQKEPLSPMVPFAW